MVSKSTSPATNGKGHRKLRSWIESFIEYTDNLESAVIWRKWAAISTIAAVLERKVCVVTGSPLYPNMYTFLVGNAGLGKTKAIMAARGLLEELPEIHFTPTSVTMAALVDHLVRSKRTIIQLPHAAVEYNTAVIMADELSAFMHEYTGELIAGLTTFWDCVPYAQGRRVKDINIKIPKPQLSILSGTTPSNLLKFCPDHAWEQGFTSRVIMVYASPEEQPQIDIFNNPFKPKPPDMIHDLKIINTLTGEFGWTDEWAKAMNDWKELGFPPKPTHPKLEHYNSRRFSHLMKLSMVACVDRGGDLTINKDDFNRAMGWLLEAEAAMPNIFKAGTGSADSKAMDEILHFIAQHSGGIHEHKVLTYARKHLQYVSSVMPMIQLLHASGAVQVVSTDKFGLRTFKASTMN